MKIDSLTQSNSFMKAAESQTRDLDDVWGTQSMIQQSMPMPTPVVTIVQKKDLPQVEEIMIDR
jgi:hypothetical protein